MSDPVWTPVLGDIGTPGSAAALALETAARVAADVALAAAIAAIPPAGVSSVFGRIGDITKQAGDYNYSDLGSLPTTLATAGITDAYTKTQSDARFAPIAVPWGSITGAPTTIAGYGISDAYTKVLSDARFFRDIPILGSDTFPQVASTALSALATGQSWVMWNGAWVATGANQAKENASVRDAAVVWDTGLTEQDWAISIANGSPTIGILGAIVRGVAAGTYIVAQWTNGNMSIHKVVAGVKTQLATVGASGPTASLPYKIRVTAVGNVITAFLSGPNSSSGTVLTTTLAGGDIATFAGGTFVGNYVSATSGTNAGYLISNVAFRNYLNSTLTLDARYLRLDEIGQTIAPNGTNLASLIALNIGTQVNQSQLKVWGQLTLGNNNDALQNSTGSGVLHMGSSGGSSIGLNNGTVHLKTTTALGVVIPVLPLTLTTPNTPALATSTGAVGQIAWDTNNIYICVAANTWKRVAVATF